MAVDARRGQTGVRPRSDPGVLVTGATGFLGGHVAEALRDAGWAVTAMVRPGSLKPTPTGTRRIEAPLEAAALASAAAGVSVIVHLAGLTRAAGESELQAVNVAGTEAVVAAANAAGARVLLISSLAAAGTGTITRPRNEADRAQPLNAYGRSKLAAEAAVVSGAREAWTIVRPTAVYGPRDRQFLPLFRLASRGWFPLAADPATPFTFIHVDDAARAIVLAAQRLASGEGAAAADVLFVGHPIPRTTEDLLRCVAAACQHPYRPRRIPSWLVGGAAWAGDVAWRLGQQPVIDRSRLAEFRAEGFVCSVDRARDVLGFSATIGLEEGVARTAEWYRGEGLI